MPQAESRLIAFGLIVVWALTGPFFDFSETWQLVINTGTTIITFLIVFLIQKSQNLDSMAVQLKLNELVASTKAASNRRIDVEDLTEEELNQLNKYYDHIVKAARKDGSVKKRIPFMTKCLETRTQKSGCPRPGSGNLVANLKKPAGNKRPTLLSALA